MSIAKVVVTGGSGRVGQHVVKKISSSFNVVNADLHDADCFPSNVDYVNVDVLDIGMVRNALEGADAVIHLAALDFDWQCEPERYIDVNVRGTWHVLQAAQEHGIKKVILCSSISACGLSEMRNNWQPQYLPVDELHENKPVDAYSVSKIVMEQIGKSFADSGSMDVICLRPLAVVLEDTVENYIKFVDDPDRHWLFYYVTAEDVASAFDAALKVQGINFGVFFLSADDTSHAEPTLKWYENNFGSLPKLKNPKKYYDNPRASIFSSLKAKELLGWKPSSDFSLIREKVAQDKITIDS